MLLILGVFLFVCIFMFVYFAFIATFITMFSLARLEKFPSETLEYIEAFTPYLCSKSGRCNECQILENFG